MFHTKRCTSYIVLTAISSWTLLYFIRNSSGKTFHESSWTCKGQGRNQVCEFTNFCVDDANGPFIIHPNQVPPKINMLNADIEMWFQPKRISHAVNAIHVNETLFVYGLFSHTFYTMA